ALDLHREDREPIWLAAQARAGIEGERLLVQGAGDLRDALLVAEDAAGEDGLALVGAGVLAGVPLAPRLEREAGDRRRAVFDRAAAVAREVAHRPDPDPAAPGPVTVERPIGRLGRAWGGEVGEGHEVGRPVDGPRLPALCDEFDARLNLVR